jgi:hypothetical protein
VERSSEIIFIVPNISPKISEQWVVDGTLGEIFEVLTREIEE